LLVEGAGDGHHHGGKKHHSIHSHNDFDTDAVGSSMMRVELSGQKVRMLLAADMGQAEEDGSLQIMEVSQSDV
jgi:hypothetical protein